MAWFSATSWLFNVHQQTEVDFYRQDITADTCRYYCAPTIGN